MPSEPEASRENPPQQPLGVPVRNWQPPSAPAREVLPGRYVRLEPLDADRHGRELFAANSLDVQQQLWTYLPYGPFQDFAAYDAWLRSVTTGLDPMLFAIVNVETGHPLGVAGYLRIDPANGSIEIGHLAFSPPLQRTRMATEAIFLLIQKVFDLGYRRCEWKCNALNLPSRSAAARLGFKFEGLFRQSHVVKGRNRDTTWFSILDSEWPALESAFLQWLAPGNFDAEGKQRTHLQSLTAAARASYGMD